MVRELHHRVENKLATVQAIMSPMECSRTPPEFRQSLAARIAFFAKIHTLTIIRAVRGGKPSKIDQSFMATQARGTVPVPCD